MSSASDRPPNTRLRSRSISHDARASPTGSPALAAQQRSVIRAALADSVVGETLRCEAAVAAADGTSAPESLLWTPWGGCIEEIRGSDVVVRWFPSASPNLDPDENPQVWPATLDGVDNWRVIYRNVTVTRPPPALRQHRTTSSLHNTSATISVYRWMFHGTRLLVY